MARIETSHSSTSAQTKSSREAMQALVDQVNEIKGRARTASADARERFKKRGQLLPRERVALLLDPGEPFLEIAPMAAEKLDNPRQVQREVDAHLF